MSFISYPCLLINPKKKKFSIWYPEWDFVLQIFVLGITKYLVSTTKLYAVLKIESIEVQNILGYFIVTVY